MLPPPSPWPALKLSTALSAIEDDSFFLSVYNITLFCSDDIAALLLREALERALLRSFSENKLSPKLAKTDPSLLFSLLNSNRLERIVIRCSEIDAFNNQTRDCLNCIAIICKEYDPSKGSVSFEFEHDNGIDLAFLMSIGLCKEISGIYRIFNWPSMNSRQKFIVGMFSVILHVLGRSEGSLIHVLRRKLNCDDFDIIARS